MAVEEPLEVAARLFSRLQSDQATEQDRTLVRDWRAQDMRHQAAWDLIVAAWDGSALLRHEPDVTERLQCLVEDYAPVRRRRWIPLALAASLAIVVGASALLISMKNHEEYAVLSAARVAPVEIAVDEREPRKRVTLADGSTALLDSGSAITVALTADRRNIRLLRGRAFFSVHKDKKRPFAVIAGRLTAVAVGTAFDVHITQGRESVTTTEGVVRVETTLAGPDGKVATLVPSGMKLSQTSHAVTLARADTNMETLWTQGLVAFDGRCLADVTTEMNRYSRTELSIAPDAATIAISGLFRRGDVANFATALEQQKLVSIVGQGSPRLVAHVIGNPERTRCS